VRSGNQESEILKRFFAVIGRGTIYKFETNRKYFGVLYQQNYPGVYMIENMTHVMIFVKDYDEALNFYTNKVS